MKRRTLLKTLGITTVGLATVPLWMEAWKPEELPESGLKITEDQKRMLTDMVDTIIPATDTPGAKDLQVDEFILIMTEDCFSQEVQEEFLAGFGELDLISKKENGKKFIKLAAKDQTELLGRLETTEKDPEQEINFVDFVKQLSIMGYKSSEYVQTNIMKFELVPARFHGSFPVAQSIYKNA